MLTSPKRDTISDRDLNILTRAEVRFRRQWARDLGKNPDAIDLLHLPPVARGSDIAFDEVA